MIMRPLASATRAAIAGAKGGSSQARKPVEAPDSLHSTDYARILDLISEGEIVGLVNGLQSVFLDETPVANGDGSLNFKNVQIDTRVGTQDQDYIKGFPAVESELGVNLELQQGTPWTRAINNTALSAIRVRLSVPTLSKADASNGDIKGHSVQYAIDLSTDGGSFVTVLNSAFTGKTSTKYVRSHRIDLPAASSGWIVRVRRITPQANSGSIADLTFVESFAEILDGKFRYPNSALAAVVVDASQFQNIPTRAYHIRGRIVQVPSNYNPTTRAYTGIWDGTFQPAWTNNPAWIYYDLATNPRYGLGHLVQASQVDKWALYKIARYCDELVSNGAGGQEPRFTCNVYLQTRVDAFKLLQDLASIFRGISFWTGATIKAVADMPEDPVYIYTAANVIDGKFLYQGSGKKARHTVAMVSWNDPDDFGRAKVEPVIFEEGIARYGINQTDIIAFGCTSKSQAQRAGRWLLFTEHMETNTVTFSVGLEGTVAQPGQVVLVADPARAGRRIGGRVSLATNSAVTVDAAPTVAPGDTISCVLPDAVAQERTVQSVVGRVITTTTPFTDIPVVGAVWTVQSETLAAQKFRVISVTENEGMTYTLTAIQHAEGKFDAVENGVYVEGAPTTILPPSVQLPPTGITITHREVAGEITAQVVVNVDWQAVPSAIVYDVEWRQGQGEWIAAGRVAGTSVDVPNVLPGSFEARITAINSLGIKSSPVKSATYNVPDQTVAPDGLITPDKVGGTGVNLLPDQYSTFENATLPAIGGANRAIFRDVGDKVVAAAISVVPSTPTDAHLILASGWSSYNINVTPNQRYIVSANIRNAGAGPVTVRFGLFGQSGNALSSGIVVPYSASYSRIAAAVDLSGLPDASLLLYVRIDGGNGYTIKFDGFMVEAMVGNLVKASPYTRGVAASTALSALIAAAGAQATADGQIDIYRQPSAPSIGGSGAKVGDYWQDSDDGRWYYCNGSSWVESTDNRLPQVVVDTAAAQSAANTAQGTANARIRLFVQESAPVGGTYIVGDMWYQPSTKLTRYFNGTGWSLQADNSLATQAIATLVQDGGFEAGGANWHIPSPFKIDASSNAAYIGSSGLVRDPGAGPTQSFCEFFSVSPGDRIVAEAMIRNISGAANGTAALYIWWYDASSTLIGFAPAASYTDGIDSGSNWRRVVRVGVAPSGATRARVGVQVDGHTTGYWAFDCFKASKQERLTSGGCNLIANSDFGGLNGSIAPWRLNWNPMGVVQAFRPRRETWQHESSTYKPATGGRVEFLQYGTGAGTYQVIDYTNDQRIRVRPGQRYEYTLWAAAYRCTFVSFIQWLDSSGTLISESALAQVASNGGAEIPGKGAQLGAFVVAPANSAFAQLFVRKGNTLSGADSVVFIEQPYFGEALPNQVDFSAYSAGPVGVADQISSGNYSVTSIEDLHDYNDTRRIGLSVKGSRKILGGARNSRASLVAGIAAVRTATAITANSSGQVTVNAHSLNVSGEVVSYSAVTNAVTGLTQGVTYVIFTLDPYLDGGVRTYYAQTSVLSAQQTGEGAVMIGNVTIPTGGTGSGGGPGTGNPGDWCVDFDTLLPDGRLVRDLQRGELVPCIDVRVPAAEVEWHAVRAISTGDEECYRLVTESGATIVQSASTPMDLPDGRVRRTPQMLGQQVLVHRDGRMTLEIVCDLQFVGTRQVVKVDLGNRMFLAGEFAGIAIATHNAQYKP
ncbi:host specificity protein J [Pseudoxanthomonas mexicana]